MLRTVDECPYRCDVEAEGASSFMKCGLIQEITGVGEDSLCRVMCDACEFCCRSPLPSSQEINPVLASLLYGLTDRSLCGGACRKCGPSKAVAVQQWAEGQLDDEPADVEQVLTPPCRRAPPRSGEPSGVRIHRVVGMLDRLPVFRCHHPNHRETTFAECDHCRDWSSCSGTVHAPVARLAGQLEAAGPDRPGMGRVGHRPRPRRRPTLEWTLGQPAPAGEQARRGRFTPAPPSPGRYADDPVYREPKLGAWPNFYLGLTELLMCDPHADAYMMTQDDVILHDREDLARTWKRSCGRAMPRAHLADRSGVMARPECGWFPHTEPWFLGAHGADLLVTGGSRVPHRPRGPAHGSSGRNDGLANIDTIVGQWAVRQGTPITGPVPEPLPADPGQTSSIWPAASMEGTRKSGPFSGDLHISNGLLDVERAAFPESAFPLRGGACPGVRPPRREVETGCEGPRWSSVASAATSGPGSRDMAGRVERLGLMFRRYQVVCLEADSADATLGFLETWADQNPAVHVLRGNPGLWLTTGLDGLDPTGRCLEPPPGDAPSLRHREPPGIRPRPRDRHGSCGRMELRRGRSTHSVRRDGTSSARTA